MLRQLAAAAGAVIACCAVAVPAARAGAAPASDCTTTSGVTVIVDFTHFGGDIERGCDPGQPANALDAMHDAGFATAGTARYGDAFLCRVDGLPSPKSEACTDTPPAKSSWSFYDARPTDRAWTYSTVGVLTYQPGAGTLIAFAFGNRAEPGVLPSGALAPTTTTTTTRPRPRRPTVPVTHPPVTAQGSSLTVPTVATTYPPAAASTTTGADTTPVTTAHASPTTTSDRTTTSAGAAPRIVDKVASGPVPHGSSGSPAPAIVTVVLVALLGGGAFALIRLGRRRAA